MAIVSREAMAFFCFFTAIWNIILTWKMHGFSRRKYHEIQNMAVRLLRSARFLLRIEGSGFPSSPAASAEEPSARAGITHYAVLVYPYGTGQETDSDTWYKIGEGYWIPSVPSECIDFESTC